MVNAGVGAIALKSLRNNKYVSASDTAGHPLYAATDQTGSWEKFNWIDFGNGKIALYSPQWNTYVSIDPGDQTASVKASSTTTSPDTWEFFYWGEA